jgi:hypothetical protein
VPGTLSNHMHNMDGNPEADSDSPPEATTPDNQAYFEGKQLRIELRAAVLLKTCQNRKNRPHLSYRKEL